jgi:hypothetical protein
MVAVLADPEDNHAGAQAGARCWRLALGLIESAAVRHGSLSPAAPARSELLQRSIARRVQS